MALVSAAGAQRPHIEAFPVGESVPTSAVIDLGQDASGRLWILSRGRGLTMYDGETFSRVAGPKGGALAALETGDDGRLWVVTREPLRLHYLEAGTWVSLPPPPPTRKGFNLAGSLAVRWEPAAPGVVVGTVAEGLAVWDGDAWSRLGSGEGLASDRINGLLATVDGVAVATDGGLCLLAGSELDCRWRDLDPRLGEPIFALARPAGGPLWLLGESWLATLRHPRLAPATDPTDVELQVLASGFDFLAKPRNAWSLPQLAVDRAGGAYFNLGGLAFSDPAERRLRRWGRQDGLPHDGVTALLSDREDNLWIGTWRGLAKIEGLKFLTFDAGQGLLEDEVSSIVETEPGRYVLGHTVGLTILEGESVTTLPFPPSAFAGASHARVLDMAVDRDGAVWLAALNLGLARLVGERWSVVLPEPSIQSVELDTGGRLWVASAETLYLRQGDRFARVAPDVEVEDVITFRWLHGAADGRLYVGMRGALLWREADGSWQRGHCSDVEATDIYNVLAEPGGTVWLGTAAGLYELRGRQLVPVERGELAIDRPVYLIIRDQHRIWFGTDDGVMQWDGLRLRHLGIRHGLAGRESNRGAGLVDHRGRVWLGGEGGIAVYQETYDVRPAAAPGVEIEALEIDGERFSADAALASSQRRNRLSVHVRVIALSRQETPLHRYRLEGFDPGWVGPATFTSSEIRYTNLPPGEYRFRVAAGWRDGPWSDEAASATIVIRPPYWRQPMFLAAGVAALGLAVFTGYRLRTRALRLRARELETMNARLHQMVAERQGLIAELEVKNLELERFTYTVSHDLKSPLVTIKGFLGMLRQDAASGEAERMEDDIQRIESAAEKMARLLDELLELSRVGRVDNPPQPTAFGELVREAVELAAGPIAARGVEVEVEPELPVVIGDRTRLVEVLQNLIENAVKYMGDQEFPRIAIGVRQDGDEPVFTVEDNGIGIDPRYHDKVFDLFEQLDQQIDGTGIGLALVRRIVEVHGGRIWVESEGRGRGCTFCFTCP